jgi:hypothetical protein
MKFKKGDSVVINPDWNGIEPMTVFKVQRVHYFKLFKQYQIQLTCSKTLQSPQMFRKATFAERLHYLTIKEKHMINFKAGKGMG